MPELRFITFSKSQDGAHPVGYRAMDGDLTLMIRRHPNTVTTAPALPGWSSIILQPFSEGSGLVTLDWSTNKYDGYIDTQSPETVLAVYTNGHIGNYISKKYTGLSAGAPPNGDPFDMPLVPLKSTNSIVFLMNTITSTGNVFGRGVSVKNADGVDVPYSVRLMPISEGKILSTAPVQASPNIDMWISKSGTENIPLDFTVYGVEIVDGMGPPSGGNDEDSPVSTYESVNTCRGIVTSVGGVYMSTNDFVNAQTLIKEVGSDDSDPIADEYEGYIANGKNERGTTGLQDPLPKQTALPDPSPIKPVEKDETVKDVPVKVQAGCSGWSGSYDAQMSPNFILRNFTIGYPEKAKNLERGCLFPNKLINIPGYDVQTRFCNLQLLAQNVLEPIWAKFGSFRINSGIRNQNSVKNGVSQHVTGEAVDIQFPGWNYEMYWENAKWIKDNIPFDQFIYEHSAKTGSVWYHLSFRRSGNRPASDRTKVMTMHRGKYDSGLRRYK